MENIKIQFKPQMKDHIKAAKLYYSKSIISKIDKVVGMLLIGCGIFLFFSYSYAWGYLLFIVLGILEITGWVNLFPFITKLKFNQNPIFKEEYTLEFSEDGIIFKTPSIDSKLAWTHYHKLMENDDIFLLIYGKRMYSVFPKSAFKDAEEINRFRDLVNKMFSKKDNNMISKKGCSALIITVCILLPWIISCVNQPDTVSYIREKIKPEIEIINAQRKKLHSMLDEMIDSAERVKVLQKMYSETTQDNAEKKEELLTENEIKDSFFETEFFILKRIEILTAKAESLKAAFEEEVHRGTIKKE